MTRRTPLPSPLTPPGHVVRYRSRIFDDKRHDPYQPSGKFAEPTRCTECGAVHERGRWKWAPAPEGAHEALCPACQRVRDRQPAGKLTLGGCYNAEERAELIRIARNEADREGREHPMHRIMAIDERDGQVEITTTDIHLPQRIGEALKRAHRGELHVHYGDDEYSVHARWHR